MDPIPEPAGTSDQVQALDLGIFSPMKATKRSIRNKGIKQSSKNIVNIVNAWLKWTNIELSFKLCFSMLFLLGVKFNILSLEMKHCIIFYELNEIWVRDRPLALCDSFISILIVNSQNESVE